MSVMQPRIWGPASLGRYNGPASTAFPASLTDYAIDAANDGVAGVLSMPKSGNIDQVGFMVPRITGSPPAYNVALVELDAAGAPTTTPYGDSEVETYTYSAIGYQTVTLTPKAAVSAGAILAVYIWPSASAPDASNRIYVSTYAQFSVSGMPWVTYFNSLWNKNDYLPAFTVRYDDGALYGLPATAYWGVNMDTGTTPDEAGMKITLPMSCKCCGAVVNSSYLLGDASFSVSLLNSAGAELGSWTCADEDRLATVTGAYVVTWAEQTLPAGTYYVAVKPGGTANMYVIGLQFPSAALRAASMVPEAANVMAVSRTDGGAWTENDTAIPWMGLLLSDITFGGGSSGPRWL